MGLNQDLQSCLLSWLLKRRMGRTASIAAAGPLRCKDTVLFLGSKLAAFCSLALLCGSLIHGAIIYTVCCCSMVLSFCYGAPVDTSYAPGP